MEYDKNQVEEVIQTCKGVILSLKMEKQEDQIFKFINVTINTFQESINRLEELKKTLED